MIIVDETDPVGDCQPPFPQRDVSIRLDNFRTSYDILEEIGRGKFGLVYRCKDRKTGLILAAKVVTVRKKDEKRDVRREVDIMRQLRHPQIIQLYDCIDDLVHSEMCLILEMVNGGELFDRVIEDEFVLTEKACSVFVRQICEAIEYIHSKSILHLDMKPENVMCTSKKGNRIKIIDFGLARFYDSSKKLQVLFGTPEFVAPEVVNFEDISYATDMWSIGVITYVLLSGLSPFMGDSDAETMANVTIAKYDFEDECFSTISLEAKDFITKLLVKDKRERLSASKCLKHPWLANNSQKGSKTLTKTKAKDPGIECELLAMEFRDEGKPLDEVDMDKSSDGSPSASSPDSSIYSSSSVNMSPTPPPLTTSSAMDRSGNHLHFQQQRSSSPSHPNLNDKRPSLELTKEHLRDFVSRWTDNPYLFDSPRGVIAHVNSTTDIPHENCIQNKNGKHNNHEKPKSDKNNNSNPVTKSSKTAPLTKTQQCNPSSSHRHHHMTSTNHHSNKNQTENSLIGLNSSRQSVVTKRSNAEESSYSDNIDHDINNKLECGLNLVNQIRRFSQQLHEELELMKNQCGSCNAMRKYSLGDASVNV